MGKIQKKKTANTINRGNNLQQKIVEYRELLAVSVIIFIFTIVTFINLGDTNSPQSWWTTANGQVLIDFGETTTVTEVFFFNGLSVDRDFSIIYSSDGEVWEEELLFNSAEIFSWHYIIEPVFNARYVVINPISEDVMLMELGFKNNGRLLPLTIIEGDGRGLFNEQHLIPELPTHLNSMYFDERLFAAASYGLLHGYPPGLEDTHPPLGKAIIALGIDIFGMTPFGYRVMGALFGILMLPLIYAFAKRIFGAGLWPIFAVALFAVDFMRFTMSRMATTDSFLIFFIIASYYYMYCYISTNFNVKPHKLFIPLALSGLFMGLAISVKWSGAYAGLGLAIVFFTDLWNRRTGFSSTSEFIRYVKPILGSCVIFFVFVPLCVYLLSYIPYLSSPGMNGLQSFFDNQIYMLYYHSQLSTEYLMDSPWYLWAFNIKPFALDYIVYIDFDNIASSIILMGNHIVWYAGLAAIAYSLFRKVDKTAVFLIIAYAAQLLPWAFISRGTFIYHYFPCVGFMVLILTRALAVNNLRKTAIVVTASAMLLFIICYPILTGIPIEQELLQTYLRWLPTEVQLITKNYL